MRPGRDRRLRARDAESDQRGPIQLLLCAVLRGVSSV